MKTDCEKLLIIMRSLQCGDIDSLKAQDEVSRLNMDEFPLLFSNLFHYFTDEELRKKDSEYGDFQNIELAKLIKHLESGDIKNANEISFLHSSKSI